MADKVSKVDKKDLPEKLPSQKEALECLKLVDTWSFDIFKFANKTDNDPLKCLTTHLFKSHGILKKFSIDPSVLENFMNRIETGYIQASNFYHNNLHAADVTQTMNSMLRITGLINWLTDLEIFACLLAAIIHDFEHTGRTNGFEVMTRSDRALFYNDRSVQENHHLSASFFILKEDNCNILSNLSHDEYKKLRNLMIDLVLSTDMAFHFQILKEIKHRITSNELKLEKSKVLSLVLHACDISNPCKKWDLSSQWSALIMKEFFTQGDQERELNLPISPLCDRYNTLIPESQINFIDFVVGPLFTICGEMLECILEPATGKSNDETIKVLEEKKSFCIPKPWVECLAENKKNWQEQTLKVRSQSIKKQRPSI